MSDAMEAAKRCYEEVPELKRLHSKLERYDAAFEEIGRLAGLKRRGVSFAYGDPDKLAVSVTRHKDSCVLDHIRAEARTVLRKVQLEPEGKKKIQKLRRFAGKLGGYQQLVSSGGEHIAELEQFILDGIETLKHSQAEPPTDPNSLPRLLTS